MKSYDKRVQRMLALEAEGWTVAEIAREVGVTRSMAYELIRKGRGTRQEDGRPRRGPYDR